MSTSSSLRLSSPQDALLDLRRRRPAGPIRLHIPGAAAEPLAFGDAFAEDPGLGAGIHFTGVWIPGVNRTDWSCLGDGAETTFAAPEWTESRRAGRMQVRPLGYRQAWDWVATAPLDAAIVQVAPPDRDGRCNLSLTADFTAAVLERPIPVIGLINPALPEIAGAPSVALSRFVVWTEVERAPATYDPGPVDPVTEAVARVTAELIPHGAVLQTGIGKLGAAVFNALTHRRGLRIHSGMASDSLIALMDAGALADVPGAITIGAILGSSALGARLADDPRVRIEGVPVTHGFEVLSRLDGLVAINSAVEVDLFGQANAEHVGGKLVSGIGGLGDFLRGAGAARGGLPILALPAETPGGKHSRIVPQLGPGITTISRTDVAIVVTEHGAADLRGLTLDGRAEALIAIAAPARRIELAARWDEIRRTM